jgi:hypothetical protein
MATSPRRLVLGAAAGALLTSGCGSTRRPAAPGPTASPGPGPTLDSLRLTVDGGFTTPATAFRTVPQLTVTDAGTVITPRPVPEVYPGPILLPLGERTLDDAGRLALADVVRASGLVTSPPPDLGTPGVADAPTTTLEVTLGGVTTTITAPALAEASSDDPSLTAEQRALRADLRELLERLRALSTTVGADHLGPEREFRPDGVWLRTLPATPGGLPEQPAPSVVDWPVRSVVLADLDEPRLVTGEPGAQVLDLLAGASELTWFRDPARTGETFQVLARPALPGDSDDTTT